MSEALLDEQRSALERPKAIWRLPMVKAITGLSRSAIYERIARDEFPSQIQLGSPWAVGWNSTEVEAWVDQQIEASRNHQRVDPAKVKRQPDFKKER